MDFSIWHWLKKYILPNQTHLFHPIFHTVHPLIGTTMLMQKGDVTTSRVVHLGNYGIGNAKKDFWVLDKKFVMWGCQVN
jgi:hypothetical protein